MSEFSIIHYLFWPILSTLLVAVIGASITAAVSALGNKKASRIIKIIVGVLLLLGIVASVISMSIYYQEEIKPSGDYEGLNTVAMAIIAVILFAVIIVFYFFLGKKHDNYNDTRTVAYGAIALALSFALSYATLFRMPQGGAITFVSLLPLMIYSYMFGIRRGIILCFLYGILQAIQDPWIIHPLQFLLDYPLAFSMIGLAGVFREIGLFKKLPIFAFILGGILAVVLRYLSHVGSGIFAFGMYAEEGYTAVAWGFLYNTFAFADGAIAIALGSLLFASNTFVTQVLNKAAEGKVGRKKGAAIEEEPEEKEEENKFDDYELKYVGKEMPVESDTVENEDTTTEDWYINIFLHSHIGYS